MRLVRALPLVCLLLVCLLFSTFTFATVQSNQATPVLVTQAVDNSIRTTLLHNVHPLARSEYDQGEAPATMPLHRILLVLKRSEPQESSLRRLIENQQNKNSSSYHQWLTPEQVGQQFGISDSDMAAVVNWLKVSGFTVNQVSNARTVIEFDGTAGLVKQAFGTSIHRYLINGEEHWANANDPSIPTALAPVVLGVNSLHDFRKKAQNVYAGKYSGKTKQLQTANPGYTFTPNGNTFYGLGPYDFATIYNVLPLWNSNITGNGVTIAIVGRTDIDPTDATDFWSLFGLDGVHGPQPTLKVIHNGPAPGVNGDESEADIDTQWSGAVAPTSTIDFVTSASTETTDGVDLSALYIVDNNLAPVVSESYGQCEAGMGSGGVFFYGQLWEVAAVQGQSAMVSTGDNAAAGCDDPNSTPAAQFGLNVNGIASSPWNTAVGGTDFAQFANPSIYWNSTNGPAGGNPNANESAIGPIPETTWNESCSNPLFQYLRGGSTNAETNCNNSSFSGFLDVVGGSGGFSGSGLAAPLNLGWFKPSWQTGAGVPNDGARDMPDVSLFASAGFLGSFYLICQKDQTNGVCDLNNFDFLAFGGTSVSSPAFAGIMALVNQKWGPQGVPGLVLYNLASKQPNAFHDINTAKLNGSTSAAVSTTIAVPCFAGSTVDCVTNKAGDNFGILAGWSTTANYDLATGLGSVDANNLVTNWNKVTFTPTTTSLTLNNGNPVNITHGAAVPVSITVTPNPKVGAAIPNGDVSLLVSPVTPGSPAIDFNNLLKNGSNSTVTWNTRLLPGGTYQVVAYYAGDPTYGGSVSTPPMSVTVAKEASKVYMPGIVIGTDGSGNPVYSTSPVVYGSGAGISYLLRADVHNSGGNPCTTPSQGEIACPTGTVNITDNGNPLSDGTPPGTFQLNSEGYTEDQGIQLKGGNHTLIANYNVGDANYLPSSTSPGFSITVNPAPTSINNVAVSPTALPPTQSFTATATVTTSSYGLAPTGAVTFLANGSPIPGTVTTPVAGNPSAGTFASLAASVTATLPVGSYTITAIYAGDTNYQSFSGSNSVQLVVGDFTLPASLTNPNAASAGQTTSTTMTLTAVGSATFGTTVTYSCSGLPAGATCTFNPTQITAGTTSPTNPPVTITVSTAGPFTGAAAIPAFKGKAVVHKLVGQNQHQGPRHLWLPLSLPLAGLVLVGLAGRKLPRHYQVVGLCLTLAAAAFLGACGGGSSSTPPPPISVTVSPNAVNTLYPNLTGAPAQTQQFAATVSNTTNTAVSWAVAGGAANGTITSSGLYTAPATLPNPNATITVTATSATDSTKSGTASINLQTPTPSGIYPITVVANEGTAQHQTTFNLTIN